MLAHFRHSFLPTLIFFPLIVNAALLNVTVDDADPSINYQPENFWAAEPGCGGCSAKPDPSQMFDETWHDSLYSAPDQINPNPAPVTATFFFTGSAIYVFCTLWFGDGSDNFSNMTFFIDDELVQNYINPLRPGGQGFGFNVPVFSKTSLAHGTHKFVMQNGGGPSDSLILFDRLVYTQGDDVTTTSTSVSTQHTETSALGLVSPPTASQSSENLPPAGFQSAPTTILSTVTTIQSPSTIIQSFSTTINFSSSAFQSPASALSQSTVTAFKTTDISDTTDAAKSSTSVLASAATGPPEPSDRSPKMAVTAGAIGGSVGGVIALAIIAFLIRRRRLNQARSEPSLVPFEASEENNPSSPTNASTAQLISPFNSTPLPKSQSNVRERDAGPVAIAGQQGGPLPPDYGQVFSQESDARTETSSSWRPVYSEDSETLKS